MKAATHLAFAGLCGVLAQGFGHALTPDVVAGLAIGALLPDVDTTASGLGKFVKPVSSLIERKFGHRTITHSLLGAAFFQLLALPFWFWNPRVFWFILLGTLSHIMLDTANVIGVPLLYPSRLQFWLVTNRAYRMPYGSPLEGTLTVSCFFIAALLYPTSGEGFDKQFHRFMGTPSGVVSDYLDWRDSNEVFAVVDGFNTETQEKIHGRYRVVDAIGKEGVIVEDDAGDALGMGLARGAQVSVFNVFAERGSPVKAREYRLEVAGRTIGDVLGSLPRARHIWITANLQARERVDTPPPTVGRYPRVKVFAKNLEIRSARISDLEPLQATIIERGSAIIRAEYRPGEDQAASVDLPARVQRSHALEVPNLPSLSGLVVKVGDRLLEGQPVARYVNDAVLEAHQALVEKAALSVTQSKAEIRSLNAVYTVQTSSLSDKIARARREVARAESLVNAGAEPSVKLAQARAGLTDLERTQLEALSMFTSKTVSLERRVQEANLTVKGARAAKGVILEKQWLRSPLAGLVSDVRVKSVTGKGVSVEVVILEEERTVSRN